MTSEAVERGRTRATGRVRRLLRYALPYRSGWALIVLTTLLASGAAVLQPWPMKVLVDNVLLHHPVGPGLGGIIAWLPGAESTGGLVAWIAAATLAFFALNSVFEVVLTFLWIRVGQGMVYSLAADLFARLERRSLVFHTRNAVGDLMSRITGDSWSVHALVDTLLFAPLHAALTTVGMLVLMVGMNVKLTLLSVALAPMMMASTLVLAKRLRAAAHDQRLVESQIHSHLQQTLTGIPVVQAFGQETREHDRFRGYAALAVRAVRRSTLVGSWAGLGTGLVSTLGTAAVLWVGAHEILRGTGSLTVGSLLVFLAYLGSLQGQLKAFANIHTALQTARAGIDRVSEVLEAEPEVVDRPGAAPLAGRASGHVRLEGVTFGYDAGRPPVLRGVSLEALPGQTVAVVGPTGAGKSTLAALVARFVDPWSGRVTLDGRDLRDLPLAHLRSQVAVVLQEPFLFPLSVAENVAYGRPEAGRGAVEAACRAANAHEFVARLPAGYDTVIGERGATLSGGQRQRLSIARALLRDAPVLVLDEPTSALDAATETAILRAIDRLTEGRTTFVIAHRFSTVRRAHKIIVLDGGVVVESGTHEQLLAARRLYARLYELQSAGAAATDMIPTVIPG